MEYLKPEMLIIMSVEEDVITTSRLENTGEDLNEGFEF